MVDTNLEICNLTQKGLLKKTREKQEFKPAQSFVPYWEQSWIHKRKEAKLASSLISEFHPSLKPNQKKVKQPRTRSFLLWKTSLHSEKKDTSTTFDFKEHLVPQGVTNIRGPLALIISSSLEQTKIMSSLNNSSPH